MEKEHERQRRVRSVRFPQWECSSMEKTQERQRARQGLETSPETDSEGATGEEKGAVKLLAGDGFPKGGACGDTTVEHEMHACARMTQGAHVLGREVSEDVRSALPCGPEEKRTHCRPCGQFGHSEGSLVCEYQRYWHCSTEKGTSEASVHSMPSLGLPVQ